ncbi:MAG: hydrogenase maturation protease [Euryarchaeota archaeon]|nr:hydrogenase maturation protease [Euryarchaeota archaeon]
MMDLTGRENKHIRVIGCGNLLMGNDSAGLRVIEILEKTCPGIDVVEGGTGGIGLLPLMEEADLIIIVDAMTGIGEEPGDTKIFRETPPYSPSRMSFQDIGVAEVMEIARELFPGINLIAIGIEAGEVNEYSYEIDSDVMAGVKEAVAIIVDLVQNKGDI